MPRNNKQKLPFRNPWRADTSIAYVRRDEFTIAGVLGEGGFATVFEVSFKQQCCGRNNILCRTNTRQEVKPLYAMKVVRQDLDFHVDRELLQKATRDLVNEAKMLSKLNHPNILTLRAMPRNFGKYACECDFEGYFIVTDRLTGTLSERIQGRKTESDEQRRQLLPTTLEWAYQIAKGLQYLHSQNIVMRDIKPENVGFLSLGEGQERVQLFDLGMARRLRLPREDNKLKITHSFDSETSSDSSDSNEETFKMTRCGTQRYMPREALLEGRYGLKSDVYSFGLVLWEMLTEQKPFHYMTPSVHKLLVCLKGERPPVSQYNFPTVIQEILQRSWADSISDRLAMTQVCDRLSLLLESMRVSRNDNQYGTRVLNNLGLPSGVANIDLYCNHEFGSDSSIEVAPTWLPGFLPFEDSVIS